MMIDRGPQFYSAIPSAHAHGLKVKITDLEILYLIPDNVKIHDNKWGQTKTTKTCQIQQVADQQK